MLDEEVLTCMSDWIWVLLTVRNKRVRDWAGHQILYSKSGQLLHFVFAFIVTLNSRYSMLLAVSGCEYELRATIQQLSRVSTGLKRATGFDTCCPTTSRVPPTMAPPRMEYGVSGNGNGASEHTRPQREVHAKWYWIGAPRQWNNKGPSASSLALMMVVLSAVIRFVRRHYMIQDTKIGIRKSSGN